MQQGRQNNDMHKKEYLDQAIFILLLIISEKIWKHEDWIIHDGNNSLLLKCLKISIRTQTDVLVTIWIYRKLQYFQLANVDNWTHNLTLCDKQKSPILHPELLFVCKTTILRFYTLFEFPSAFLSLSLCFDFLYMQKCSLKMLKNLGWFQMWHKQEAINFTEYLQNPCFTCSD